jgi:hypothetical protein
MNQLTSFLQTTDSEVMTKLARFSAHLSKILKNRNFTTDFYILALLHTPGNYNLVRIFSHIQYSMNVLKFYAFGIGAKLHKVCGQYLRKDLRRDRGTISCYIKMSTN